MKTVPTSLEGLIEHDRLHYPNYVKVDGKYVKNWIWDRLASIPKGSYIKIDVEILEVPSDS